MHEPNTMFESSTISIFNINDEIFTIAIIFRKDILFNGVHFSFISRVKHFCYMTVPLRLHLVVLRISTGIKLHVHVSGLSLL